MPLDFPASPTNGQIYDRYVYNSSTGTWNVRIEVPPHIFMLMGA